MQALIPYRHGINNVTEAELHLMQVGITDVKTAWLSDDQKTSTAGRWLIGGFQTPARREYAYFAYIRPPGKYALSRLFYDIELNLSYATGH